MGIKVEEEIKAKSVLKEEEFAYLSEIGFLDAAGEEFFSEQKNLFLNEQISKVWDAWRKRNWLGVLEAILKIPADIDLRLLTTLDMVSLGRTSLLLLFRDIRRHFTIEEVRTVSQFSRRIGQGLDKEPLKEMFLNTSKLSFPHNVEKMIETVKEAGIDEKEYRTQVLREIIFQMIYHGTVESFAEKILAHENLLDSVDNLFGFNWLDREQIKLIMKAADHMLTWQTYPRKGLKKPARVYEKLRDKGVIVIGRERAEIIELSKKWNSGKISRRKLDRRVDKLVKKLETI